MVNIKVKYLDETIEKLKYVGGSKSDWIDLRSAGDYDIKKGDFTIIHLGVAMEIPNGYEVHIVPRSSTFSKTGLIQTNGIGIIDNSYCGPNDFWFWPAYATMDIHIEKNQRLCQFRLVENQPNIQFEESDLLSNTDRGGHGSTGTR